jgi:hypothetical protein
VNKWSQKVTNREEHAFVIKKNKIQRNIDVRGKYLRHTVTILTPWS